MAKLLKETTVTTDGVTMKMEKYSNHVQVWSAGERSVRSSPIRVSRKQGHTTWDARIGNKVVGTAVVPLPPSKDCENLREAYREINRAIRAAEDRVLAFLRGGDF